MKQPYLSLRGKVVTFLLCAVISASAFWSGIATLSNWDDLWSGGNYYDSNSILEPLHMYYFRLRDAMDLHQQKQWEGTLPYSQQEQYNKLMAGLEATHTNFRYQVHDESGNLIASNLNGQTLDEAATRTNSNTRSYTIGADLRGDDYYTYSNENSGQTFLVVYTEDGPVTLSTKDATHGMYNEYGYMASGDEWDTYDSQYDTRVRSTQQVIEYGVHTPLEVQDDFWTDRDDYEQMQRWLPLLAITAGITLLLTVCLLILLCRSAGRRRDGSQLPLSWQDRIPLELYAFCDFWILGALFIATEGVAYNLTQQINTASLVGAILFSVLIAVVIQFNILTLVVRGQGRTLWRGTLCAMLWRKLREGFSQWPMIARAVILFVLYLTGTVLTGLTMILIPVFQGFVLWHICRYVKQWHGIRAGTMRMVSGEPDHTIDTHKLYPDLKDHAETLNDLGASMARAVEEQLKGERFKAELITNVSHDLKTPLTSIISYVDLLKKIEMTDPAATEYIDVLARKSQRLKKLTEDLVEASKASTGNLTVTKEKLGFTQLLNQALGEYEEKLEQSGLSVVSTMPDHELYVEADGRHLWRVIDNLLGNCVKYAMAQTRVYVDVKAWDGRVCLSVKNISQTPLNVPADQLMERFVRGDASRTAEGSGLGLSIAQSLTELQGGTFRLDIDGDLFKAVVTFPEYKDPIALPNP